MAIITQTVTKVIGHDGTTSRHTTEFGKSSDGRLLAHQTVTDNGAGGFIGGLGEVNYGARSVHLKMVSLNKTTDSYKSDYEDAEEFQATGSAGSSSSNSAKGGEYGTTAVGEEMLAGNSVVAQYRVAPAALVSKSMTYTPAAVTIDLCPFTSDRIVPGSVRFSWMGTVYDDFEGRLYRGRTSSNPGIDSGAIDYETGVAHMSDYVVGGPPTAFTLLSLWTARSPWSTASIFFRTQAAPVKPGGLVLSVLDMAGDQIIATAGTDGNFTGDHVAGRMNFQSGVGELQFGDFVLDTALTAAEKAEWWYDPSDVGAVPGQAGRIWRPRPVDPTTLRYNAVSYFYLPLDAEILGLDPVRLPTDGRVPIFRRGGNVVIGHTGTIAAASYANGATINCGRVRLSRVYLVGADGALIEGGYTPDLDAGTIHVDDIAGWLQPVVVKHRIEQMNRLADVQINGRLTFLKPLSHDFPAGTVVASAIVAGDLRARALPVWDQVTWNGQWADGLVGDAATASYNDGAFPPVVTNEGAITQRFVLVVKTGGIDVDVIGENVGNLGTYSRNSDIAPINPISGAPYFTLRAAGWGSGWAVGNALFLPTVGAFYPVAAIRTVQPSEAVGTDYAFEILARGDVDRAPTSPVI